MMAKRKKKTLEMGLYDKNPLLDLKKVEREQSSYSVYRNGVAALEKFQNEFNLDHGPLSTARATSIGKDMDYSAGSVRRWFYLERKRRRITELIERGGNNDNTTSTLIENVDTRSQIDFGLSTKKRKKCVKGDNTCTMVENTEIIISESEVSKDLNTEENDFDDDLNKRSGHNLRDLQTKDRNRFCNICGAATSSFHWGVLSCESCSSFFQLSYIAHNVHQYYECSSSKSCIVNHMNKNNCNYCRLHKCIALGMTIDTHILEKIEQEFSEEIGGQTIGNRNSDEMNQEPDFSEEIGGQTIGSKDSDGFTQEPESYDEIGGRTIGNEDCDAINQEPYFSGEISWPTNRYNDRHEFNIESELSEEIGSENSDSTNQEISKPIKRRIVLNKYKKASFGFHITTNKLEGTFISNVDENSIAARAGLIKGDRILKVGTLSISKMTHKDIAKYFSQVNYTVRLVVINDRVQLHDSKSNEKHSIETGNIDYNSELFHKKMVFLKTQIDYNKMKLSLLQQQHKCMLRVVSKQI